MFESVTPLAVAAPLVATIALVLFARALRQPRTTRWLGPAADGWEYARRLVWPLLDRLARRRLGGGHYASYELQSEELVGVIDAPPEEVEQMLWGVGYRRMPLAALKTLPDGRTEVGSWAWRDGLLADRQVHIMLFRGVRDGETLVAAHEEPNALSPFTALDHYRGVGMSVGAGERAVRERLDEGVWADGP